MFFGEYELSYPLGKGGMAQVFLARRVFDDGSEKAVVIKVPRAEAIASERTSAMFLAEGKLAKTLEHPNIVSVFDAGTHEGVPYIVMAYIAGMNLHAVLRENRRRRKKISIPVAAHILRELLYALRYLHRDFKVSGVSQRVVHRDVSSKNVILSGSGAVMLIDFGIASALGENTSSIKGTFRYMAPEQMLAQASPATDIFGAGTILWELLEGKPFRGHLSKKELPAAVARGVVPPITRKGVPKELKELLGNLLHPDPSNRCSAVEALAILESKFLAANTAIQDLVLSVAGQDASRSGYTKHNGFKIPEELQKALAVAKATKPPDSGSTAAPGDREPDAPQKHRRRSTTTQDAAAPSALLEEAPDDARLPVHRRAAPGQPTGPLTSGATPSSTSETGAVPTEVKDASPSTPEMDPSQTEVATGNEGVERDPTVAWTRWIDQPESTDSALAQTERIPTPSPAQPSPTPADDGVPVGWYREISPQPSPSPAQQPPSSPTPPPPPASREPRLTDPLVSSVDTSPYVDEVPSTSFADRLPPTRWLLMIPAIMITVFAVGLYVTLRVLEPAPAASEALEAIVLEESPSPAADPPPPQPTEQDEQVIVDNRPERLPAERETAPAGPAASATPPAISSTETPAATASTTESRGEPSHATRRTTPAPKAGNSRVATKRPKVPLALRLGFVERVDVRIGRRAYELLPGRMIETQVPSGKTRIRWRFEQGGKWTTRTYDLVAGHRHVLLFEGNGPRRSSRAL